MCFGGEGYDYNIWQRKMSKQWTRDYVMNRSRYVLFRF